MADPTPPPSFETAPRLQPAPIDPASAYAPIAWSAVAAVAIGGLFVLVLLWYAATAIYQREPLVEPWIFALPAIGIAVAFLARRQVAAAEGTRIGKEYAAIGWWLCVVGGLVYAAYLGTLEYTVRADAAREFQTWANSLPATNSDVADQPELLAAFYSVLPIQQRGQFNLSATDDVTRRKAQEGIRALFGPQWLRFRQNPILMQAQRYGEDCTFVPEGIQNWKYQAGKIECVLKVQMRSPEADFPLVVPMEAMVTRGGGREWQVKALEAGGGQPLFTLLGQQYGGWVIPSAKWATTCLVTGRPVITDEPSRDLVQLHANLTAAAGVLPMLLPPNLASFSSVPTVTLPGGSGAPPANELRAFLEAWQTEPSRFALTGMLHESLAESAELAPIALSADRVQVKIPLQYKPHQIAEVQGAGVRVRLVLECSDPEVVRELNAALASAGTDPRTDLSKSPAKARRPIPLPLWKPVRIESDFKVLQPPQSTAPGKGLIG